MTSKVGSGDTAVLLVAAAFTEAGLAVLEPIREDLPFDLAVWSNQKFYRFQVKRAQRQSSGAFQIPFRKTTVNSKGTKVYKYTEAHTDFIVGVIVDTCDFYCIPMSVVNGYSNGAWVNPKGRSKFARKARVDFERFRNKLDLDGKIFRLWRATGMDEEPVPKAGAA